MAGEGIEESLSSISDRWCLQSVNIISSLQHKLEGYESWAVDASVLGDNREAFTFFFPLIAGISNELGGRALWATILVEWSNLWLKWLFVGHRPYWWIGETRLYDNDTRPQLRQFANTCEAGPGSPSGHLMLNTALFFVICKGIAQQFIWNSKTINGCMKYMMASLLYSIYILWIGIIFISRLYIQAHFIHQNILGILFGLVVGNIAWRTKFLIELNKIYAVIIPICLMVFAMSLYRVLLSQGMDPLWSIPLAIKHCRPPGYVRADTRPFFLVARFTGAALGLGLGIASEKRYIVLGSPKNIIRTILTIKAGIVLGRLATLIQTSLPTDDMVLFLALSFSINVALPFTIIALLPHFLLLVYYGN